MKKKIILSPLFIIVLLFVLGIGAAGAAIFFGGEGRTGDVSLQKGLVGHWKMDGNAKDSTPYGNNGTLYGSNISLTTDRKGQTNKAYVFNGTDDYVTMSGAASILQPMTVGSIELWVKMNDLQTGTFLSVSDANDSASEFLLYWNSGVGLYAYLAEAGTQYYNGNFRLGSPTGSPFMMTTGVWYHLVFVHDGVRPVLYVNGVYYVMLNGETDYTKFFSAVNTINNVSTGTSNVSTGSRLYLNGLIDEVRIYNRTLTPAEVLALYESY